MKRNSLMQRLIRCASILLSFQVPSETSLFFILRRKQWHALSTRTDYGEQVTTDEAEVATCYANTKEKGGVNQSMSYRKKLFFFSSSKTFILPHQVLSTQRKQSMSSSPVFTEAATPVPDDPATEVYIAFRTENCSYAHTVLASPFL